MTGPRWRQIAARAWGVFRPTWKEILLLAALDAALVLLFDMPVWVVALATVLACTVIPAMFGWLELKNEEADREESELRPESAGEVD